MFRRRDLIRLGLASGVSLFTARKAHARFTPGDPPPSPRLTPFVQPLPVPPILQQVAAFRADCSPPPQSDLSRLRFYKIIAEERAVRLHPDLPPTVVWG